MANPILDKITKLNAEIEQLRAENSYLRRVGVDRISAEILALQAAALAELRAENERLRAENERMRQSFRSLGVITQDDVNDAIADFGSNVTYATTHSVNMLAVLQAWLPKLQELQQMRG